MESPYAIEMLHITKRFPGIIANDDITLQLKKGEIHALLGENGAGKSTLMSVLFGLYQAEEGVIKKDGVEVSIKDPNDANALAFLTLNTAAVLKGELWRIITYVFVPTTSGIFWLLISLYRRRAASFRALIFKRRTLAFHRRTLVQ